MISADDVLELIGYDADLYEEYKQKKIEMGYMIDIENENQFSSCELLIAQEKINSLSDLER